MLEVLVAFAILSIVIASASSSMVHQLRGNKFAQVRSEASYAAQTVIDNLRRQDISAMPTTGSDAARTISMNSKRDYDVIVSYCTTPALCSSANTRQVLFEVKRKGEVVFTTESVFTYLGLLDETTSSSTTSSSTSSSSSSSSSTSTSSGGASSSSSGSERRRRGTRFRRLRT